MFLRLGLGADSIWESRGDATRVTQMMPRSRCPFLNTASAAPNIPRHCCPFPDSDSKQVRQNRDGTCRAPCAGELMHLIADLRFILRQFRKAPVFTVTILVVLALGVGATTAIFGLFDQVLLRTLPVSHPEELVRVQAHMETFSGSFSARGGDNDEYTSYPAYRYLRDNTGAIFSGIIATNPENTVGIAWHDRSDLANAELVSGNYFQVLGVPALLGRTILPPDDTARLGSPVAMLSYGYWQRRFGGDARVIGQALQVNGHAFTIVGVAPQRFRSVNAGEPTDLFVPMMMRPVIRPRPPDPDHPGLDDLDRYNSVWVNMVARLKPGVTAAQATAALKPIWHAERILDFAYQPNQSPNNRTRYIDKSYIKLITGATGFSPLRDTLAMPMRVLMGMGALVLLMACANVASLLLVRAAGRVREMSVRYALGAKRQRIVQHLLMEGLSLGLVGGTLGLLLAQPVAELLIRRIQGLNIGDAPYSSQIDLRLLLIALATAIATSLVFSLAPALQFWRPNLMPALKQQSTTSSGGALMLRRVSVGVQIALSVLLLAAAGLFLRTVSGLRAEDLGFRPDHLVEFTIDPRLAGYSGDQVTVLDERILNMLHDLPGVKSASASDDPEMAGNDERTTLHIAGYEPAKSGDSNVEWSAVMPGYLETIGAPLIAGRSITDADRHGAARVAVISESAAKRYFGSPQNALGRSFMTDKVLYSVVGVFGEIRHVDLRETIRPRALYAYLQDEPHGLTFVVRTAAAPAPMMETVRAAMQQFNSNLAIDPIITMDIQLDASMAQERTLALLASAFGILAALMSAVGLYGVLAFDILQRTREIGVRMALGATRPVVARLLLIETLRLAGISIAVALPLAWGLAHLIRSLLFGVKIADPLTYFAAAMLVGLVGLAAASIPTWRAASTEPMRALRYE
jgi:putative ABC transport system permease protein